MRFSLKVVHRRKRQLGLSLIELMIGITLGIILLAGVMQMFLSSRQVFSTQQAISRIQETGRLAMEFMGRDIRMAGYVGCMSRNHSALTDIASSGTGFHKDYSVGFQAFSSLPTGVSFSSAPVGDVLVIRSAQEQVSPVNAVNAATTITLRTPEIDNNGCSAGICPNKAAVISDCNKGRIFTPLSLAWASGILTVTHAAWNDAADSALKTFGTDAEVMGMKTVVYYVSANSLWQWDSTTDQSNEILEGVEKMAVAYGLDTDNDNIPNNYVSSATVGSSHANWQRVLSVRISLLVRSVDDNVLQEKQPYNFDGVAVADPGDRRMRQVFVNTLGIRSRLP